MLKKIQLLILFLMVAVAVKSQNTADSTAIRATALDYIEGWYAGNADRMERALHPKLAKRMVYTEKDGKRSELVLTSALELVQQTRRGGGSRTPASERMTDVRILDIYSNAASVRVDAGGWIDYMHMVEWNGEWKIINVLWELNPERN